MTKGRLEAFSDGVLAIAYYVLQTLIVRQQGCRSKLAAALGRDLKGKISPVLCLLAIVCALRAPLLANGIFVFVALMWLVPDRRIEKIVQEIEA